MSHLPGTLPAPAPSSAQLAVEVSSCPHSFMCPALDFAKRKNSSSRTTRTTCKLHEAGTWLPLAPPAPTGHRRSPHLTTPGPDGSRLCHTYPPLPTPGSPPSRPRPTARAGAAEPPGGGEQGSQPYTHLSAPRSLRPRRTQPCCCRSPRPGVGRPPGAELRPAPPGGERGASRGS